MRVLVELRVAQVLHATERALHRELERLARLLQALRVPPHDRVHVRAFHLDPLEVAFRPERLHGVSAGAFRVHLDVLVADVVEADRDLLEVGAELDVIDEEGASVEPVLAADVSGVACELDHLGFASDGQVVLVLLGALCGEEVALDEQRGDGRGGDDEGEVCVRGAYAAEPRV